MSKPRSAPFSEDTSQADRRTETLLTADEGWVASVRRELAEWYARNRRDLPWRREINPYRVLVSEMMLVQTTVAAVIPYFERFLKQFPDPQTLAAADEEMVLKAWEGLGYYRRARQLQAAARKVVEEHGGEIPPDLQAIHALPGVGRYMAGAILSFAFNRPAPILEANSQRLLARLVALRDELKRSSSKEKLWAAAEALVPLEGAGDFNQALIDLGALICTPREPRCLICPLSSLCEARRLGLQDQLPVIAPKESLLSVVEACALVVNEGRVLVVQRGEGGLWSRFWEFPTVNLEGADPAGRAREGRVGLAEGVERSTGIPITLGPQARSLNYTVTRHRVTLRVYLARGPGLEPRPGPGYIAARWVTTRELGELTLNGPGRKLLAWIDQDPGRLDWPGGR
ncbi:MAG: A/G-specific adenine glycosylase [Isosphaeraceae bacterium]